MARRYEEAHDIEIKYIGEKEIICSECGIELDRVCYKNLEHWEPVSFCSADCLQRNWFIEQRNMIR